MNTNNRGARKTDVIDRVGAIWNDRFATCLKRHGYTQKTFAFAFKLKYSTGNQTDVNRWGRVGHVTGNGERIGFPSYDTMRRIADFFGVTVGYLTGETDFDSFNMEHACTYLGISQEAGRKIRGITTAESGRRYEQLWRNEGKLALDWLLTSQRFGEFIFRLSGLALVLRYKSEPRDYVTMLKETYDAHLVELASKFMGRSTRDGTEEYPDSPEFWEVLSQVELADAKEHKHYIELDNNVKVAKYVLYEVYMKMVDEVMTQQNLEAILACRIELEEATQEWLGQIDSIE